MLQQILSHTPVYVWAILAFLLYRGFAAMRDREMGAARLAIVPVVMLGLSLQDVLMKFGGGLALAAWGAGLAAMALLVWRFGGERIAPGSLAGQVRVRGSRAPLALMMAVFCTKYAAAVALAVLPRLRQDALFAVGVCACLGVFSGCFLGCLARDLAAARRLQPPRDVAATA